MEQAWTYSPQDVLKKLQADPKTGLDSNEVEKRRKQHGPNELEEAPPTPLWQLILDQFQDQLVLILLASAVISFVLALLEENESWGTAMVEPGVIFLILIANATVGVVQERNADQAIDVRCAQNNERCDVFVLTFAPHHSPRRRFVNIRQTRPPSFAMALRRVFERESSFPVTSSRSAWETKSRQIADCSRSTRARSASTRPFSRASP